MPRPDSKPSVTKISEEIKYEVLQLDQKMEFKFNSGPAYMNQAMIGNAFDYSVDISKVQENI
jgi:hypothetical protein